MPFRQARQILDYWKEDPPEHELLGLYARVRMGWKPNAKPVTEEEARIAHRKSLEERWAAGAMNIKQMWEATGGVISADGTAGVKSIGPNIPGIGPFPGAH